MSGRDFGRAIWLLMSDRETELTRRLAETFHLSVHERGDLPGGKVRGSILVGAVGECLAETGWFPKDWRPDQPYNGLIIEAQADGLMLHEKREIGTARFSDVRSVPANSLDDAVRTLVATMFGDDIDGVQIDWTS
jgi:hypothetical protein